MSNSQAPTQRHDSPAADSDEPAKIPHREIPTETETLSVSPLPNQDDREGSRRVEKVYRRVVTEPEEITRIESGDSLMLAYGTDENLWTEYTIVNIGSDVSSIDGIHVRLGNNDRVIQLSSIHSWLEDKDAIIHGERTKEYTELKGFDY